MHIANIVRYTWINALIAALLLSIASTTAHAQKQYDQGVTDTEIKLGNMTPYSGPVSAFAGIGKTQDAYFRMINERGGINGRKIVFLSYDDAYSPPKAVEQARKLVEADEVFAIVSPVGTPSNVAIQKYMNSKKVPQLFVIGASSRFADPKAFPWTMGWLPTSTVEARIHARYLMENYPDGKIGILYQNDDLGKEYVAALRTALGAKSGLIVAEASYEVTSPTIESQVLQIMSQKPDVFLNMATSKAASQAIKKAGELGWKPVQLLTSNSINIAGTIKPAGFEHAQGIVSFSYMKDPNDKNWATDPGMIEYRTFMEKHYPEGNKDDFPALFGYSVAKTVVHLIEACGDNLTRANLMKQAAALDFDPGVYFPGIRLKTGPSDFNVIEQMQPIKFKGENWEPFGGVVGAEGG